jgi:hypothetical protein
MWRLITDTHTWPHWGPSVRAVDCTERFIRAGSSGRIRTPMGIWVPFAVESFELTFHTPPAFFPDKLSRMIPKGYEYHKYLN